MPQLRTVEVYPMSGWWGTRWLETDPDGDAFAKVSRGVCDAYSAALSQVGVPHTVSTLRIFIGTDGRLVPGQADRRGTAVVSPTYTDRVWEGFESAAVQVAAGFAGLTLDRQRRIVLDAVHAAAEGLATFRGLERAPLHHAKQAVIEAGYVFTWCSPWKSSSSRRWRARCVFQTMPDGFGRLRLEVATAERTSSALSPEQVAFTTAEGYRRAATTLRWTAADRLQVIPYIDFIGHDTGRYAVAVDADPDGSPCLRVLQTAAVPGPPRQSARSTAHLGTAASTGPSDGVSGPLDTVSLTVPDRETRRILTVGGGPTNYVPEGYWRTLHALFRQLHSAEWQAWWAPATVPTLELSWWADVPRDRLFVRRGKDKVIARIERTGAGLRDADPIQAARDDLSSLLVTVQRRMALATPPDLR